MSVFQILDLLLIATLTLAWMKCRRIEKRLQIASKDSDRLDWLSLDHKAGNAARHYLPWHDSLRSAIDAARTGTGEK